jgi:UDPglucose 6-dehydrogenase
MRVGIVGAGYVGLVTGAGLAQMGHQVMLVDVDRYRVDIINKGQSPIHERGLEVLLRGLVPDKLKAALEIGDHFENVDVIFICVQSSSSDNEHLDLTYVMQAAADIGRALMKRANGYPVVAVKSTVSPGSAEGVIIPLLEQNSGKKAGVDFGVVSNPEFLREGTAIADFTEPDRIIVGGLDPKGEAVLERLYGGIKAPVIKVDYKTAEMIKFACNAFLAAKVSFINEIGNICKLLGVDGCKVAEAMGADPRISPHYLRPGIGFGGSCLPKDTKDLSIVARRLGYEATLLRSVLEVNERQPLRLVDLAEKKIGGLRGKRIAVLGLAFKPGTDDLRKAPSIQVVEELLRRGAVVVVYDPEAMSRAKAIWTDGVAFAGSAGQAVSQAEAVLILTEWEEFRDVRLYSGKAVFDGRRVLSPGSLNGLNYSGICW